MLRTSTRTKYLKPRWGGGFILGLAAILILTACSGGGRDADRRQDRVERAPASAPGTNRLLIPELLEPTIVNGVDTFELSLDSSTHDFGSGDDTETIAYNDESILGPTLRWTEGNDVQVQVTNNLDDATTTHWHGADVPASEDGGPHSRIEPGQTWTADFPVIQPAATLWYHPHLMGNSAQQLYAGAAAMILIEDDNPATQNLPSTYGVDDVPVILQDREFDANRQLVFEIDSDDNGDLNPELTVNGTTDPFTTVPAGPVRLRLVNSSQARIYSLSVDNNFMVKIASDGGYLPAPVPLDTLTLGPGDRAEIIVDASNGAVNLVDAEFGRVLELRPNPDLPTAQPPPDQLATVDRITADTIDHDRLFVMDEVGHGWGINGHQMDMNRIDETIRFGDTERWTITALDGIHTFHVHQIQFQILDIDGRPPPPQDSGWEDTVLITEGQEIVIAARFDSYTNPEIPYMYHCHVLDHEEAGMMGQFQVVRNPDEHSAAPPQHRHP